MTRRDGPSVLEQALAFKAYEIEELADVYFFRPLGAVIAHAARRIGLTPNQLTTLGGVIGAAAGSLLYDERLGLLAFALLVVHSIIDSADGQLARMTGQASELGRLLDGVGGYATYAAVYVALVAGLVGRGSSRSIIFWAALSAAATIVHEQLYDYHRTTYTIFAIKGRLRREGVAAIRSPMAARILSVYDAWQRLLVGLHGEVEQAIASRSRDGAVSEPDRARYRACFYWPVRGWNVLGDNTRFYAIGVLAWIHHLEWFFAFILLPMNLALAALWFWQWRADRRFLAL